MRIQEMFQKDIDRDINGVVKVDSENEQQTIQELEEYVVTRELQGHFDEFFSNYSDSLDRPTEKMGVWISGFFGSGKSHFLKMLSYLLENPVVGGKHAVEYFTNDGGKSRFDNPMTTANVERCAERHATTILFNIDNIAGADDGDAAILYSFARAFYNAQGFYGNDLKIARLEQLADEQGKTAAFRNKFLELNGMPWESMRKAWSFYTDDVIGALAATDVMSETEAERYLGGGSLGENLTIDSLTDEIRDYVARKKRDDPHFKLVFLVDEIGQFIGENRQRLLNLQTLVEELGIKCTGDVWVAVTSQEAIDEVTAVKAGDFSKIQGRFNTRLSFSSASVGEVIQRRILAKKPEVERILEAEYANKQAVLKNLFTFQDADSEIRGYRDAKQFSADFPFVSYQFPMLQKALVAIRSHGSSGKSLSDGARSMLAGFQEAAQAVEDENERALVPFWRFYDTLQAFLDGTIQTVIRSCERSGEDDTTSIRPHDVQVLKTLFLIRYISEHIKSTPENIAILMVDDIDVDAYALRQSVQATLDRLCADNYIGKSGETYTFLTNEEQDVANEIKAVTVDVQDVVSTIGSILYEQLMPQKTLRYEGGQFPIAKYVDNMLESKTSEGLELRIITDLADEFARSESQLLMQSQKPQCVIALGEGTGYVDLLFEEARIRKYERTSNLNAQTSTRRDIIRAKVAEARTLRQDAVEQLKKALSSATCYISGSKSKIQGTNYERAINDKLTELVANVYPRFSDVEQHVQNDGEVGRILANPVQESFDIEASPNGRAIDDVRGYLNSMSELSEALTVDSVKKKFSGKPYGWTPLDVAGILADLVARKDVVLKENGMVLDAKSREARTALTNEATGRRVRVELRKKASEDVRRHAREALRGFYEALDDPTHVIPANDDDMADDAATYLESLRDELLTLVREEYGKANYPGRAVVEGTNRHITDILHYRDDPSLFFQTLANEAQTLRNEALEVTDVRNFFPAQQRIYDNALEVRRTIIEQDAQALEQDPETSELVDTIVAILGEEAPYGRIPVLGMKANKLREAHGEMVAKAREDVGRQVQIVVDQMRDFAREKGADLSEVDAAQLRLEQQLQAARSISQVNATIASANEAQRRFVEKLSKVSVEPSDDVEVPAKTTRTLTRTELIGLASVSSERDVEALLSQIRTRLMDELSQADVVQIY